jgi:predicted phosphodiesterase
MTGLTWLHLSDWHQGEKNFDRQIVLDALIDDIKKRVAIDSNLEHIDFIVFSGDIAFSGKSDEYKIAKEQLFGPILRECNIGPEELFIVPGNHDLDRTQFDRLPQSLANPLESAAEAEKWLYDIERRHDALKPFKNFVDFVSQYTKQENSNYSNIRSWTVGGKRIALLGINSAWMCARRKKSNDEVDDKGVVVVGEPQIYDTLKDISEFDIKNCSSASSV